MLAHSIAHARASIHRIASPKVFWTPNTCDSWFRRSTCRVRNLDRPSSDDPPLDRRRTRSTRFCEHLRSPTCQGSHSTSSCLGLERTWRWLVPSTHSVHALMPAAVLNLPLMHGVRLGADTREKVPGLHCKQKFACVAAVVPENIPAAHSVHTACLEVV